MRTPNQVVNTTMRALQKNKITVADGLLGKIQAILPHFGTLKMRTKINAFVCRKWKDK